MITIRIDNILKAISIERGDRQRIYVPRKASMHRLQRILSAEQWNCTPDATVPFLSVFTKVGAA